MANNVKGRKGFQISDPVKELIELPLGGSLYVPWREKREAVRLASEVKNRYSCHFKIVERLDTTPVQIEIRRVA